MLSRVVCMSVCVGIFNCSKPLSINFEQGDFEDRQYIHWHESACACACVCMCTSDGCIQHCGASIINSHSLTDAVWQISTS